VHAHGASERADTHTCPTRRQARKMPDIFCGLTRRTTTAAHMPRPEAGRSKSRGRHGSVHEGAHRWPNFTGDRSEARGHGAAYAELLTGGCAQGVRAGANLTVLPRASVEGARRCCNSAGRARRRPSAGVELADGAIEAAQGHRIRVARAQRCTGPSRTTPFTHSADFLSNCHSGINFNRRNCLLI